MHSFKLVHSFKLAPSCTQQQRPTAKPASGIHTDACERTSAVLCSQWTPVYISHGQRKPCEQLYNPLLNSPTIIFSVEWTSSIFGYSTSLVGKNLFTSMVVYLPLASTLGAATIIICGASAHCPQGRCVLG